MEENTLSHFDKNGSAIMVDVTEKEVTERIAIARGTVVMNKLAFDAVKSGNVKKGDVLQVARTAGIMAAKRTYELIPLCHMLPLTFCRVEFSLRDDSHEIVCECAAKTTAKTGAEMEALTGVSTALLTVYDMCKALDRAITIKDIHLIKKSGGKSGVFERD